MEELLITGARFLGALPMFVAVGCLVLMNRGKLQSAVYNRSRWFITAATLILGVQFAIQFAGQLREQSPTLCWTLNMMAYVIATPLYNMAELNLLCAIVLGGGIAHKVTHYILDEYRAFQRCLRASLEGFVMFVG